MKRKTNTRAQRSGKFSPSSFDAEAGTVDIVYSSGPVSAVDRGDYVEELLVDEASIDATRLDAGAVSLLLEHEWWGPTLGRVVAHRVENGEAIATVQLSDNADMAGIISDIRSGVRKSVSVGYDILAFEETDEDGRITRRITRWSPFEISMVNVPADVKAQVRAKSSTKTRSDIGARPAAKSGSKPAQTQEKRTMSMKSKLRAKIRSARSKLSRSAVAEAAVAELEAKLTSLEESIDDLAEAVDTAGAELDDETGESVSDAIDAVDDAADAALAAVEGDVDAAVAAVEAAVAEAIDIVEEAVDEAEPEEVDDEDDDNAERSRAAKITRLAERHGMPLSFVTRHISKGSSVSKVRRSILSAKAERSPTLNARSRITRDEGETQQAAIRDALHSRLSGSAPSAEARSFMPLSLFELGKRTLGAGFSNADQRTVFRALNSETRNHGATTTGDLGLFGVLGQSIDKRLVELQTEVEKEYEPITRKSTVRNFMPQETISSASFPALKLVPENGQIEFGTAHSDSKHFSIAKYGRKISFTFEAFINDDLRWIDALLRTTSRVSDRLERDLVWDAVNGDGNMSDGLPIFDASRGNVIDAPLDMYGLQQAQNILRRQTDHEGNRLGLRGRVLIVSPELDIAANQLIAPVTAAQTSQVNPFAGRFQIIVDDELEGPAWKLMAGMDGDHVEIAELEGFQGLHTETEYDPNISATTYFLKKYIGAQMTGYRGWVASTGTGE